MSLMHSRNEKRTQLEATKPKPKRTSILEQTLAAVPDGRNIALSFAREVAVRDERFQAVLREYDTDPLKDLGDICESQKIPPAEFLGEITKEAYPYVEEAVKLAHVSSSRIVARRLAKVVERGYIEGAKKDGVDDRHQILMKEGFHIAPKGNVINMNQVNAGGGLRSFEEETRELSSLLQSEAHQLGPAEDEDFIEVEEEEEERIPA